MSRVKSLFGSSEIQQIEELITSLKVDLKTQEINLNWHMESLADKANVLSEARKQVEQTKLQIKLAEEKLKCLSSAHVCAKPYCAEKTCE